MRSTKCFSLNTRWLGKLVASAATLAAALFLGATASAQIVSYTGGTYSETFDSMGATGTLTPNGWYVRAISTTTNLPLSNWTTTVAVGDGTAAPSSAAGWNLGSTGSGERALGTAPTSNDRGQLVVIQNDSPAPITQAMVSFDLEQWRTTQLNNVVETVPAWMSFDGTTWTQLPSTWNLVTIQVTGVDGNTADMRLDGNLPANRRTGLGGLVAFDPPLAVGGQVVFRWHNINDASTRDAFFAIDNFTFGPGVLEPVAITTDLPASTNVLQGRNITLSVAVSGSLPRFQWFKGGSPIDGATSATLTLTQVPIEDNGAQIYCNVQNDVNSVNSTTCTLTVDADTQAPTIAKIYLLPDLTNMVIYFNEQLTDSATNRNVYYIETAAGFIYPLAYPTPEAYGFYPTLVSNRTALLLQLEEPTQYGITATELAASSLVVTYAGGIELPVEDYAGNDLVEASYPVMLLLSFQEGANNVFTGFPYEGCHDTELRGGTVDSVYQGSIAQGANVSMNVDQSDGNTTAGVSQALVRFDSIIGTDPGLIPPGATIKQAWLYLKSTENNAQSANTISMHLMLQDWAEDTATFDSFVSGVQTDGVEAGSSAYASFVPNFANPGGNEANTRTITLDITGVVQTWVNNPAANKGFVLVNASTDGYRFNSSEWATIGSRPQLVVAYSFETQPVTITAVPANNNITLNEGQSFNFEFGVGGTAPQMQWFFQRAGTTGFLAIQNATNNSYGKSPAIDTDSGLYYLRVSNSYPSETNSPQITVTVNRDTVAPTLVSVVGDPGLGTITLTFSKAMAPAGATNPANYRIDIAGGGTLPISGAVMVSSTVVRLTTDPRALTSGYTVVALPGVTDAAYRPNPINPSANSGVVGQQITLIDWNAVWTYFEALDASLDGQNWMSLGYTPSGWLSGQGVLAIEDSAGTLTGVQTLTGVSTNDWTLLVHARTNTAYFRHVFDFPYETAGVVLTANYIIDDGLMSYLNGDKLFSFNLNTADPGWATNAAGNATENVLLTTNLTSTPIQTGQNILAASLHPSNQTSSDAVYAIRLLAQAPSFVAVAGRPTINVQRIDLINGDVQVRLTWTGNWTLVVADTPEGPYNPVVGAASGYTVTIPATGASQAHKFYGLKQP